MKNVLFLLGALLACCAFDAFATDPLPSWNDGTAKRAIIEFVARTTRPESGDFVAAEERIAVFDNDGTLWAEQPLYFQGLFVLDRIRALAPQHPQWATTEPYKSAIKGDIKGVEAVGEKGLLELMTATHAGMTTDEFDATVSHWVATAKHPGTGRPYTAMVYQPMLELLAHLRASCFKTYIVSGGGQEFMRPWTQRVYGIPPEQVVGSNAELRFELRDGQPVLIKLAKVVLVDDAAGKPVGIQRFIGRRPIVAFGNSDGDLQMLQWTAAGHGAHFVALVHHTDARREWAYDRSSPIGRLDKALDEAERRHWVVVDMARDWKTIYPPGQRQHGSVRQRSSPRRPCD